MEPPYLKNKKTGRIQYFKEGLDKFRICEAESEKYIFQKTFLFISAFPLALSPTSLEPRYSAPECLRLIPDNLVNKASLFRVFD